MMPFNRSEEMFDEVNPSMPFVWRCYERDFIVGRKESEGCVSSSPPPLFFVFVSVPLAPAKFPHKMVKCTERPQGK